ncbi:gp53-like domain-containing protein [Pseudomonas sp. microsymbiont 2]
MADLPESDEWVPGIYQLETSDPVLGGPDGIDNRQATQLGNRTRWLRNMIQKLTDGAASVAIARKLETPRALRFKGAATGAGTFDGSSDCEVSLTLADSGVSAGAYTKVTVDKSGRVIGGSNPTTVAGVGLTDVYTKLQMDAALAQKSPGGFSSVDVAGSGEFVLSDEQASKAIVYLTGALTGDRTIILPRVYRSYTIRNATSNPYKVTVKMSVGSGVEITQGRISNVFTDTNNTLLCQTDFISPVFLGTPTTTAPPLGSRDAQVTSAAWVGQEIARWGLGTDNMVDVLNTDLKTMFTGGRFFIGQGCTSLPPGMAFGYLDVLPNAGNEPLHIFSYGNRVWRRNAVQGVFPDWEEQPRQPVIDAALGLKVDKSSFSASLGESGWAKRPDGLIEQWGRGNADANGRVYITFPIAFPNQFVSVSPLHQGTDGVMHVLIDNSFSRTGCQVRVQNAAGAAQPGWNVWYRALGY